METPISTHHLQHGYCFLAIVDPSFHYPYFGCVHESGSTPLLNLTLIPVEPMTYNPRGEGEEDVAEWEPGTNECWFAGTVIQVKLKYGLSVDQTEAEALDGILESCNEHDMTMHGPDWPECVEE